MPTKRYFSKSKREPGLGRFIFIITLVVAAGGGAFYAYNHFSTGYLSGLTSAPAGAAEALAKAKALLDQGNLDGAAEKIGRLADSSDPLMGPRAVLLSSEVEEARGNAAGALEKVEASLEKFRTSPEYPALAVRQARLLEKAGRAADAVRVYESLRDNAPPEMRAVGLCGLARAKEQAGDLVAARDLCFDAVKNAPWGGAVWNEAVDSLGRLNVQLIFSPQETPESRFYAVEKGDSITSIGIKLNTTQGLLVRANNLGDNTALSLGQRLKHTPKDFHIIIDRSSCQLFLFDNKGLFKRYRVGLGMPGHETTPGKYTIGDKQKDPAWFKPGFGRIPPGDPANELGVRWMPLVPTEPSLPKDLGIHGTIAPDSIGQFSSHGCARMLNEEVVELYDLVVRSTPVAIVEKYDPAASAETAAPAPAQAAPAEEPAQDADTAAAPAVQPAV